MTYDFSGLTPRQKELLTFEGWQMGSTLPAVQPSPQTVKKLIDRGLIVEHLVEQPFVGNLTMTVREYEVPLLVHMAWCERCAKKGG